MGCAASNELPGGREARRVNRAIDTALNAEKKAQGKTVKLLLLGAGETGKSTVLKQMKLIYGTGFTPEETLFFRNTIILNLVTSIQTLVMAMHRLHIPFGYDPDARCVPGLDDLGGGLGSLSNLRTGGSQHELDGGEESGMQTHVETLKDASGSDSSGLVEEGGQSTSMLPNVQEDLDDEVSRRKSADLLGVPFNQEEPTARMAAILYHRLQKGGQKGPVAEAVQQVGRTAVTTYGFVKGSNLDAALVEAVKSIWADSGVQYCHSRRNEYHLMDCCAYLMSNLDRITQPEYMPTDADILNARVMTAAITETRFTTDALLYRVFDVGGQRSERKKWAGYFEDVNSILFLVAISGYDLMCYEDEKTNQIVESKNVFSSICNHPMFKKTNIVLFMNKIDLFKEKVKVSQISQYFPQYTGSDNSWEQGSDFFTKEFLAVNKYPERGIYPHLTWATDTSQIKVVINAVHMEILKQCMAEVGML